MHAAELEQTEYPAGESDPLLPIKQRGAPAVFQLDGDGCDQHQRARKKEKHRRRKEIEYSGTLETEGSPLESLAKNQPAGLQDIDTHPARFSLEETDEFRHIDA